MAGCVAGNSTNQKNSVLTPPGSHAKSESLLTSAVPAPIFVLLKLHLNGC